MGDPGTLVLLHNLNYDMTTKNHRFTKRELGSTKNNRNETRTFDHHCYCRTFMGFLKRFYRNVLSDSSFTMPGSDFERIPKLEIESHLSVATYGDFNLTDAVRPSFDLRIVPRQGYRHDVYRDESSRTSVPVLIASVSADRLFETFIELLDPLGHVVDVVLETSHQHSGGNHVDLYREQIDLPILKSFLYDFEEMLLNDGCTGIAVLNPAVPFEVQFDEHKMLIVYAEDLNEFEKILKRHSVVQNESMQFLTEAEHVHSTKDEYLRQFRQLQTTLGIDEECPAAY